MKTEKLASLLKLLAEDRVNENFDILQIFVKLITGSKYASTMESMYKEENANQEGRCVGE